MCVNDVCVCDKIDWMENGWMDWIEWMWKVDVESGKWIVESGKWRGSGSHTCIEQTCGRGVAICSVKFRIICVVGEVGEIF